MLTDRLWCEIRDDDPIDQSRFFSSKTHDTPSQFLHMVAQVCPPYKILSEREIIKNLVWFHALTISKICAKEPHLLIPKQGIRNFFIFFFLGGWSKRGSFLHSLREVHLKCFTSSQPQSLTLSPGKCTLKNEYDSKTSPCSSHYEQVKEDRSIFVATTARENNGTLVRLGHKPRDDAPTSMGRGWNACAPETRGLGVDF